MPLTSLPNELLDNLVDRVAHTGPDSLKALALVSRYFLHRCRYHLIHTIRLSGGSNSANRTIQNKFEASPAVFKYPRNLSITQCFDFLLYEDFALDGEKGFLRMVDQLDNLRNLDIIDEEHPDSTPRWNEMSEVLQTMYRKLLAHPLIHLSISLPKGFPDHLISSISTLQELNIDDVTESLDGGSAAKVGSSNLHWGSTRLQYCHRGIHPTPLLRNMSGSLLERLTRLTLDITTMGGHLFAWSKMLPACRSRLLSLALRYTGPSSRYPGGKGQNIVSAALGDVTTHAFPSLPRLLHLRVELHSFNDSRDPLQNVEYPYVTPNFQTLFLHSILGGQSVRRSLITLDINLNWTSSSRLNPREPMRIVEGRGWAQVDDALSSEELFPTLIAVRIHTAVRSGGRLFMSYDDHTSQVISGLRAQAAAALEKTQRRLRVLDVGDETIHARFNELVLSR